MHSTDNLEDDYIGSGRRLWLSINKHGRENHNKEILEFLESRKALKDREYQLVNEDALKDPMCMNLQPGGGGGICDDEHEEKLHNGASSWIRKQWDDPEYRAKMSKLSSERMKRFHADGRINQATFTGKSHSEETKRKMREAHKNRKNANGKLSQT